MQLISVGELAKRLSVPPVTVYAWARRGQIPYYKVGKCVRFDETEIQAWLQNCKQGPGVREH